MGLNISNETNDLVSVILGIADEMGKKPSAEDCIDPKTKYHIINNSYPKEEDCKIEIENFNNILFKNKFFLQSIILYCFSYCRLSP